jgi:2-keto-4-pentenoate hydratase/2-oxohepta-3-ene-1,7-dioic acid hydratase in catechol pathway
MKIICIGRNYLDHIAELHNEKPDDMVIFMKPQSALHFKSDPWFIPDFSKQIHYECEIVVKISKNGKHIQPKQASTFYEEISLGIDFTARDLQTQLKQKGLPWERAKAFDHSAVVGEFQSKANYDLNNLSFEFKKNGVSAQRGHSANMIYNVDAIIVEISKFFTLNKGDLLYTGTPSGVAPISIGDRYEGILEGKSVFQLDIR